MSLVGTLVDTPVEAPASPLMAPARAWGDLDALPEWCMSGSWRPIQAETTLPSSGLFCPRCVAGDRCAFHNSGLQDVGHAEGKKRGFTLLKLLLQPEPAFGCSHRNALRSRAEITLPLQDLIDGTGPFDAEHRHHVGALLVDSCMPRLEDVSTEATSSEELETSCALDSVVLDDSDACSEVSWASRSHSAVSHRDHAETASRKGRAIQNAPLTKNMPAGAHGVRGLSAKAVGGGA